MSPPAASPSPAAEARQALASGDRAAVGAIARRYGAMLRGVVRRILLRHGLSPDLEEDILQDIFVSLLRDDCAALASWDPARAPLDTYLRLWARSRAVERLRARGRDIATDEARLAALVDGGLKAEDLAWLDEALRRYRAECKEDDWQFLVAVSGGHETAELQAMFGLKSDAVYKRKQRLRDRLLAIKLEAMTDARPRTL